MEIKVLDCTLRDGAYVTNSGFSDIGSIVCSLENAGIDIIECGWLREDRHEPGSVMFHIPQDFEYNAKNAALMFDYGRYDIDNLPVNNGKINIIRIAFHKESLDGISFAVEKVKSKGYQVFLQPSNIMEYSDLELGKLCKRANFLGADAVYIVDSFGSVFPEDLDRIMSVFDDIVDKNIEIGFHSHNNIQLSFALSIRFINYMKRDIIVDSSLCGLGRGAGNTKTELLLEYLNKRGKKYNTDIVWDCINKNILPLYEKYNWEYNPVRGFKGIKGIHPDKEIYQPNI